MDQFLHELKEQVRRSRRKMTAPTPVEHLRTRPSDGWDLSGVDEDQVHLMAQTMETWIAADRDTLATYYGQGFRINVLPTHQDLEDEDKAAVGKALNRATERIQKGRYDKVRRAAELLVRIEPGKARQRYRHCERLFATLDAAVAAE